MVKINVIDLFGFGFGIIVTYLNYYFSKYDLLYSFLNAVAMVLLYYGIYYLVMLFFVLALGNTPEETKESRKRIRKYLSRSDLEYAMAFIVGTFVFAFAMRFLNLLSAVEGMIYGFQVSMCVVGFEILRSRIEAWKKGVISRKKVKK